MPPRDRRHRLHDEPVIPFRVRLTNNTTIDITNPGLVIADPNSAVMPIKKMKDESGSTLCAQHRTIALSHAMKFVDVDGPQNSKRRSA